MSEQRFIAEQVDVVNEDETEVWDIVFDTEKTYAFMVRDTDTANDLCGLLNEQQATIDELRLQKKDNGLSVYVVRDGKNPVAMFFNEQRASFYCQEHMANLTYQQEKWCRVE